MDVLAKHSGNNMETVTRVAEVGTKEVLEDNTEDDPRMVTNFRGLNYCCKRAPHPTQDTLRQVLSIPSIGNDDQDKKMFQLHF